MPEMPVIDLERLATDVKRAREEVTRTEQDVLLARQKLARLETALAVLSDYETNAPSHGQNPYRNLSIADAVTKYLVSVGGRARMTDIRDEMRTFGVLRGQEGGHYGTLVQTLKRNDKRFERTATGMWRLRERDDASETEPTAGGSPSRDLGLSIDA